MADKGSLDRIYFDALYAAASRRIGDRAPRSAPGWRRNGRNAKDMDRTSPARSGPPSAADDARPVAAAGRLPAGPAEGSSTRSRLAAIGRRRLGHRARPRPGSPRSSSARRPSPRPWWRSRRLVARFPTISRKPDSWPAAVPIRHARIAAAARPRRRGSSPDDAARRTAARSTRWRRDNYSGAAAFRTRRRAAACRSDRPAGPGRPGRPRCDRLHPAPGSRRPSAYRARAGSPYRHRRSTRCPAGAQGAKRDDGSCRSGG